LIEAAIAGRGQVAIVEGEAGIGKTRLLNAVLDHARGVGLDVFEAGCDDLQRIRPFGAITQALGISTDSADADRAAIADLLEHVDADGSTRSSAPTPGIQFRVVEALGAVVERLATDGPLVLALEDIHWADASTLIAMRSIAQRTQYLPVMILCTGRPGHDVAALHRVVDDLLRAGGTRVALGPLDADAVASLVAEILGTDPSPEILERMKGATGNPLFITEYVRALEEVGGAEAGDASVPLEFRLTVLRRLGDLSEDANDVLRLASVLGSTFSVSDLAIVLGRPAVELTSPLQQAVARGIIGEHDERLAFRHDLVRDAIYEHIPLNVRRQLHREVGRRLSAAGVRPLVVAHHMAIGADGPDDEASGWLRRAARDAATRAPTVAVELLERARDLQTEFSPDRDALLAELVMARAWSGRLAEAETLAVEVLGRAPEPTVAGMLRCGIVYALTWQGRPAEALRYTVTAPDEILSERDATLLQAEASLASIIAGDFTGAAAQAATAAEEAHRIGHDLALCQALNVQAWATSEIGDHEQAIEIARRAIDIADRSEHGQGHLAHPRFIPGASLIELDRLDEAEEMLQAGRRLAESMGLVWSLPIYHGYIGVKRFVAGDFDGAVAEFEATLAIAEEVDVIVGVTTAASALAVIQLHRDDLSAAEQTVANAQRRLPETSHPPGLRPLVWAQALVREARGDLDDALSLLRPAWDVYMAGGMMNPEPRVATSIVRILVRTGNPERAAALLPFIDRHAAMCTTATMRGWALRCRGLIEGNAEILVHAVDAYRQSPRPLELAAACEDAGTHLGRADRLAEAISFLEEAGELYEEIGAVRDGARVRSELRKHGVTRGTRGRQPRATEGWDSLTKTELKVLSLVAQRLSNPEVAERMFVSRHTIESHLKHIYRKLRIASRVELAAEAARH
jgi:DNA-binding CsgD family transcriptional regulator